MSEQGRGRYNRSFGGLIAAMVVVVVAVVGVWTLQRSFSEATREQRGGLPTAGADWRTGVEDMQDARGTAGVGFDVVYPRSLPEGWYANTEPRFERDEATSWQLGFVEGESRYVGIQQSDRTAFELVQAQVDASAEKDGEVTVDSAVGRTWTEWSDDGGDHALTAEVGGMTVVVWGPDAEDLRTFVGLLTTEPLERDDAS